MLLHDPNSTPFYLAVLFATALSVAVAAPWISIQNDQIIVDGNPVDLSKVPIVEDTPQYTTYNLTMGNTVMVITKGKEGHWINVQSAGPLSEEDRKKMEELGERISAQVGEDMVKMQEDLKAMQDRFQQEMEQMKENLNYIFRPGFPFNR